MPAYRSLYAREETCVFWKDVLFDFIQFRGHRPAFLLIGPSAAWLHILLTARSLQPESERDWLGS